MRKNKKAAVTYTRLIIDEFKKKQALSETTSIPISEIKLPFSEKVRDYLLENLQLGGFIRKTKKDYYWFDNYKWEKSVNKMLKQYLVLLIAPIVITLIIYVVAVKMF